MKLTLQNKQDIYYIARRQFVKDYGQDMLSIGGCVYWALVAHQVIKAYEKMHGIKLEPLFQAGSLSWPITPSHLDDGKCPTHFSFMWSPRDFNSVISMAMGGMPEIHCWIALKATNELVDFSTSGIRPVAEALNYPWRTKTPPDFLWTKFDHLPEGVFYQPEEGACKYLFHLISNNLIRKKKDYGVTDCQLAIEAEKPATPYQRLSDLSVSTLPRKQRGDMEDEQT